MKLWSGDLFPSSASVFVFIAYMSLFVGQGILVTASKSADNTYNYNTVVVVLLTECLKIVAAFIGYFKDHSLQQFFSDVVKFRKVLLYYFVPAGLYCLYNNLQFTNLANYDPTTYYLLLQFRVVLTGIIFQVLFSKKLRGIQWVSLILLTGGCIMKEVNHASLSHKSPDISSSSSPTASTSFLDWHLLLILVQVFCSCFAGVYNEYLLKDAGCEVPIMMQNIFMYIDSIACNVLALVFQGSLATAFTSASFSKVLQPLVLAIMVNNAAIGIVVSLFLSSLNSILKNFASALELMFTAILAWIIFGIPIDIFTFVALFIVCGATILYAQNPVVNLAKNQVSNKSSDETVKV